MTETTSLPRSFRRIRLELARAPGEYPEGDPQFGYQLFLPLTEDGQIDADLWSDYRDHFRVVRFRPDGDKDVGHVIRRPGGSWAFRYDISGDEDDESGYRFQAEKFVVGEYVSVKDDGEEYTFRIVSVERD